MASIGADNVPFYKDNEHAHNEITRRVLKPAKKKTIHNDVVEGIDVGVLLYKVPCNT